VYPHTNTNWSNIQSWNICRWVFFTSIDYRW